MEITRNTIRNKAKKLAVELYTTDLDQLNGLEAQAVFSLATELVYKKLRGD